MTNGTTNVQQFSLLSTLADRILLIRTSLQTVSPLSILTGNITLTGSVLGGVAQTLANRQILTGVVSVTGVGGFGILARDGRARLATIGQNILTAGMPLPE